MAEITETRLVKSKNSTSLLQRQIGGPYGAALANVVRWMCQNGQALTLSVNLLERLYWERLSVYTDIGFGFFVCHNVEFLP